MNEATRNGDAAADPATSPVPGSEQPGDQGQGTSAAKGVQGFSVPLSFELAMRSVPLARLQALQQGAVLEVEASDGTLPVRILASGRLLAEGTLVSIGDGYGVLIGERIEEE